MSIDNWNDNCILNYKYKKIRISEQLILISWTLKHLCRAKNQPRFSLCHIITLNCWNKRVHLLFISEIIPIQFLKEGKIPLKNSWRNILYVILKSAEEYLAKSASKLTRTLWLCLLKKLCNWKWFCIAIILSGFKVFSIPDKIPRSNQTTLF